MKINELRGELTVISAKKEPLALKYEAGGAKIRSKLVIPYSMPYNNLNNLTI